MSAHHYLADALDTPPAARLSAPVTVVVAADDPFTPKAGRAYRDWELLAERVGLHELADGGHYFLRTRPARRRRPSWTPPGGSPLPDQAERTTREVILIPGVTARR